MKRLCTNFQRRSWTRSIAFLTAAAGMFLSVPTLIVEAGQLPSPPQWYWPEMEAINLYEAGINQENSDPQSAVKTLRQARLDSTAAIANGGGCNAAVVHNDSLIGHALMMAMAAARTPPDKQAAQVQTSQTSSGGRNVARPAAHHIHVIARLH